jgi:ketosteroid isomerase-like protein
MGSMPTENVDTVRRGYDAWNRGDLDAVREIYAPDVVANAGGLWPAAGEVEGPEAIIHEFASILAVFETSELVPEDFIERGDTVVVVPTCWRGTLAGSGSVIEQHLVCVYTLRDALVVRIDYLGSLDEALRLAERAGGRA